MSDEDLREIGLTPNAVGQLRSIVKSQTTNGLNQISTDKKLESTTSTTHTVVDPAENEVIISNLYLLCINILLIINFYLMNMLQNFYVGYTRNGDVE